MAYINTGYARNKTLTVTKGLYSQKYDLCTGFTPVGAEKPYPSISDEGLATLSDEAYERRLLDFIQYVYSLEAGLQTDCPDMTVGSVVYDTVLCPLSSTDSSSQEEK